MSLFELKIEIPATVADTANEVLLEQGAENWSLLEDVIAKRAWLVGISPDREALGAEWTNLSAMLRSANVHTSGSEVLRSLGDADWRDSYKAHFHAWQFGRLHWVPVWEKPTFKLPPGDAVLWLDPGLAFGTGNHETTRLVVERLVGLAANDAEVRSGTSIPALARPRRRLIDAGCGSGILALSAVLLGFPEVAGFDNDPEAVRVSAENAALNELTGRVTFFGGDLVSGLAGRTADVVLANIQADVLIRFARPLVGAVAPGGALVLSGILAVENTLVCDAFRKLAPGWTIDARTMGEWSDILAVRPE
jgi:ribosomal protein L11 methyltransferase